MPSKTTPKSLGDVYTDRQNVIYGQRSFKAGKCVDGGIVKGNRKPSQATDAPYKGKGAR